MPTRKPKTLTPAVIAANRRNALKSTGPITKAGKRRSALNSRHHGLIPPGLERQLEAQDGDVREFRRLHRDVLAILQPHQQAEVVGVELLAGFWWEKARRIRDGTAADPPRTDDLDASLEELLQFVVQVQQHQHAWWRSRLASVIGRPIGSPANVRRRIEARLFIFGVQPGRRPYPRKYRIVEQKDLTEDPLLKKIKAAMELIEAEAVSRARAKCANEPIDISHFLSI